VWGNIRYDDDDFIHFCNVRFLSRHYRYSPEQIMHMRGQHRDYYIIHNNIWREAKHNNGRWNRDDRKGRHNNGRWNSDDRKDRHDNGRKSKDWKHDGSPSHKGPGDVKSGGSSGSDKTPGDVKSGQGTESKQQTPPRRRTGSGRD